MNNNTNYPRVPASRVGATRSFLGQMQESPRRNNSNDNTAEKEGIVEKLQGVLVAVRRDRDREHRSRDIAMEKLRSTKEIYEAEKSNFEAEKEKLSKTQDETERTQEEILQIEETIQHLEQKVRRAMSSIHDSIHFVVGIVFLTFVLYHFAIHDFLSIDSSMKICFASVRRFNSKTLRWKPPPRNEVQLLLMLADV